MSQDRKNELERILKEASDAYYNLDLSSPSALSDDEYDKLREELKSIDPNSEEVVSVGAPVPDNSVWEKMEHEIPMGSLNKANTLEEMNDWAVPLDSKEWFITHKVDGSSMELVYINGKLERAITRGNGIIGENVIDNIRLVPNIPKSLKDSLSVTVRGEIVMMKKVFEEKYSSEYANPRNTAAGKVREKKNGGQDCANLRFLAYDALIPGDQPSIPNIMEELFNWLVSCGFEVPHEHAKCSSIDEVREKYEANENSRNDIEYEIDGMVVSVNDRKHLDWLGSHNMRPKGQIAWKFKSAKQETTVRDVIWGVGNSGRVTGVAILDPVQIGGVTITNVSLHNLKYFRALNLFRGCRVLVSRRGDVIPYIERNLEEELV